MAENNARANGGHPPKINLSATQNIATAPKKPRQAHPLTPPRVLSNPEAPKKETTRLDLSSASAVPAGGIPHDADDVKRSTTRIEWTSGTIPVADTEKQKSAKRAAIHAETSKITLPAEAGTSDRAPDSFDLTQTDEQRAKGDTAKLNARTIASANEASMSRTARIDLREVLDESDDIFKRRTAMLDTSKFEGITDTPGDAPRTIRIKRPGTMPTPAAKRPEPVEEAEVSPLAVSIATGSETVKKNETSRIDLPPEVMEQPPTRRKTIRIKRPEGIVTSKPLVIGKPGPATGPEEGIVTQPAEEEAGALFSALAVVAVLISIALITVQSLTLRSFLQF